MTLGSVPGRISMTSGVTISVSFWRFPTALESMANTRSTVRRPSSRPRRMRCGRVEMMPSAPCCCSQSTATSRGARPPTRSRCTAACLPASWVRSIQRRMLSRSPPRRKTTRLSQRSARGRASSSFTAGSTGDCSKRSMSLWRIGIPPFVEWNRVKSLAEFAARRYEKRSLPLRGSKATVGIRNTLLHKVGENGLPRPVCGLVSQ